MFVICRWEKSSIVCLFVIILSSIKTNIELLIFLIQSNTTNHCLSIFHFFIKSLTYLCPCALRMFLFLNEKAVKASTWHLSHLINWDAPSSEIVLFTVLKHIYSYRYAKFDEPELSLSKLDPLHLSPLSLLLNTKIYSDSLPLTFE